jgi:hypothetical protein
MPRFFFHFQDDAGRLADRQGMTLPDAEAAWYQGVRSAREITLIAGRAGAGCRIEIEDEKGEAVAAVPFEDLIRVGV